MINARHYGSTKSEQLELLSLSPSCWSIEKVSSFFEFSISVVRISMEKNAKGILSEPSTKAEHKTFDELKQADLEFYECDDFTRMCLGKIEFITIKINGNKENKEKRLLSCNLNGLHVEFLKWVLCQISFLKFCQLRPKWCHC